MAPTNIRQLRQESGRDKDYWQPITTKVNVSTTARCRMNPRLSPSSLVLIPPSHSRHYPHSLFRIPYSYSSPILLFHSFPCFPLQLLIYLPVELLSSLIPSRSYFLTLLSFCSTPSLVFLSNSLFISLSNSCLPLSLLGPTSSLSYPSVPLLPLFSSPNPYLSPCRTPVFPYPFSVLLPHSLILLFHSFPCFPLQLLIYLPVELLSSLIPSRSYFLTLLSFCSTPSLVFLSKSLFISLSNSCLPSSLLGLTSSLSYPSVPIFPLFPSPTPCYISLSNSCLPLPLLGITSPLSYPVPVFPVFLVTPPPPPPSTTPFRVQVNQFDVNLHRK